MNRRDIPDDRGKSLIKGWLDKMVLFRRRKQRYEGYCFNRKFFAILLTILTIWFGFRVWTKILDSLIVHVS